MKIKIVDIHKTEKGNRDLPSQFHEVVRNDLIQRAVLSLQAENRQAYGTKPGAGTRQVSEVSRRRRDYKGTYGIGISRVPRKIMSRNGTRMTWVGAIAPGTVGGRQAHPPKAEKNWSQKINEKENRKAIRSAISATVNAALVKLRGHRIPKEFPFVLDNKVESLNKTKDVEKVLDKLGFEEELQRTERSKVRSGKGKNRGRKYHNKKGPIFVVGGDCPLLRAAKNIPGMDAVIVNHLNAELLAPGCHPGRLTLWTENAIDKLANENLFSDDYQGPKQEKKVVEVKKEKKVKHEPAKSKSSIKKENKETKKEEPKREIKKEDVKQMVERKAEQIKKEERDEIKKVQLKKEHAEVENIMKELKAKAIKK